MYISAVVGKIIEWLDNMHGVTTKKKKRSLENLKSLVYRRVLSRKSLLRCPLIATLLLIFNPLNAELNPICHLLALLRAHHIVHVSRVSVIYPFVCPSFAVTGTVRIWSRKVASLTLLIDKL